MPPAGSDAGAAADTPPPARPAVQAECDLHDMPPLDVIAGNIATTSLTGLGRIVSAGVTNADSGYVQLEYQVDVMQQFAGKHVDHVRLVQTAERGIKPPRPGTLLFFSACLDSDGSAYEPDVGYVFPVSAGCRDKVGEVAKSGAEHAPDPAGRTSVCHE